VAIPDKILKKSGEVVGVATTNGAAMSADPNAKWYDVMTHTGSGLADHVGGGDLQYIATHAVPGVGIVDSGVRMAQALGRDWESSDMDGVKAGMEQQAGVIADQAAMIWDGETPQGQPLSTFQRVGMAFGLLSGVEQLVSIPLGMIPFPALPAMRILDTDIGLPHAHMHPPNLTPPNPVPVPLPSTGPIIPIPILSGASKVLINNMPAARCGDMGLGIWCGGYFPMYEIFLGSSSVWLEGARAARVGVDITKHCIFSAPKPQDPPVGPMFGSTINCSPNVMIGGFPMPSLTSMAFAKAFKALFKGAGKLLSAARRGKAKPPVRSQPGNIPEHDPRLRGPTSGKYDVKMTPWADAAILHLPPGGRTPIKEINASELAAMTRVTGDEFAVVVGKDGKLYLLRGVDGGPNGKVIQPAHGDQVLVHTHPSPHTSYSTPISAGDANGAHAQQKALGWDHPEAVIDSNGNVHHFDGGGVVADPKMSPIGPDGNITGLYTDPRVPGSSNGGMAIPPAILNPQP
jgi:uncharacterized Zn-binding protein involved in type VI secretion